MVSTTSILFIYCLLIALASVTGGRLPKLVRMTHLRTQMLMSGVGGLMLGIAMLHLLPHAGHALGSYSKMGAGALIGMITMFLLIRLFHTHDHGVPVEADADEMSCCQHHDHSNPSTVSVGEEPESGGHPHHEEHSTNDSETLKGYSWAGLYLGLTLHTLVDGVALASSVIADGTHHHSWLGLAGLGTFLAIALHKPLDSFAITSVMNKQKWSEQSQNTASLLFSLACPVGALLFFLGAMNSGNSDAVLGWGLAISAGFFIGIALADLLPEVAFHDHDRGKLTTALLFGVAIAVGIENLPGHEHADSSHDRLAPPMQTIQQDLER